MYIQEEDEDKKTGVKPESTSIGAGGLDASSTATTPPNKASNTNTPSQPEANQNFATVQDYLKANTTQGNELGDKFANKLDTTLSGEKSAIDTGVNAFGSEVTAGTVGANAGLVNEAASTPANVADNPNKLSDWLKQYNAAYTGPSSFESSDVYAPVSKAANDATQKAGLVGDTGGREQLLQDEFNDYGQGNRGLDQALLQNSGRSADIQAFAPKFAGVADYLKQASGSAANQVTAGTTTSQDTKDAAHTAITGKLTDFQKGIQDKVSADQSQAASATELSGKLKTDMASGNADAIATDLKQSGVPDDQIKSISEYLKNLNSDYSVSPNLSSYYNFNPAADITAANAASPEDYKNAAAYKTLTGVDYNGVLDPANASQAGTWSSGEGNVNIPSLTDYLKNNLASQDNQFLATPPSLDKAQQYVTVAARQNIPFDKSPALQQIYNDAKTALATVRVVGPNDPRYAYWNSVVASIDAYRNGQTPTPIAPVPTGLTSTPLPQPK